ncbi:UNVERIFIED_CONTAM: hypothetical protein FKN15_002908 [Acipenser sinensis]
MKIIFCLSCVVIHSLLTKRVKSNEEDIVNSFNGVLRCLEQITRHEFNNEIIILERLHRDLEDHTRIVSSMLSVCNSFTGEPEHTQVLIRILEMIYNTFRLSLNEYETRPLCPANASFRVPVPPTVRTGAVGRPRYCISREQINHCISPGFRWQSIATCFGIHRRTLFRLRHRLRIQPQSFAAISNHDLNREIFNILQNTPNAGETYALGSLRGRNLRVQRWRVRQSIRDVDPVGRAFRPRMAIRRRIYNVQSPNQL